MTALVESCEEAGGMRSALATLADLHAAEVRIPIPSPYSTGFHPLDEVINGGIRAGDLLLLGGKPGQGKTIATMQWTRHLAGDGTTCIVACYEHDEVTLLTRLLACELGTVIAEAGCQDELRLDALREGLRQVSIGAARLREVIDSDPLLGMAEDRLVSYADRVMLFRASGTRTDVDALRALVDRHRDGRCALFVDYVQKIPIRPDVSDEAERVKRVVEGLKDLALTNNVPVIAIAAADRAGLTSRRLRLHHFRGSTALAYEADVVVVLNDKVSVVSKLHLAYDSTRFDEFRKLVVFTIEKNRNGPTDIDLEFGKDFVNFRFDPRGHWVSERLWDEGTVED
jgi:replicative DNA helicase